ncbi:MAG: phosphotransferase, partial [Bacteroidota bacterium]
MTGITIIHDAFKAWTGRTAYRVEQLPRSGSSRIYYRVFEEDQHYIAVWNPNVPENDAFVYLSRHFRKLNIQVPEILHVTPDREIYFQTDLGGQNLLDHRLEAQQTSSFPDALYQQALSGLVDIQVDGSVDLDFQQTYPRPRFDERVIRWDLNYFKYSFLNPMGITYDQDGLEDAFQEMIELILSQDASFFLYRDFQSRNILIHQGSPWFIDFQGGMQGPLLYDVAAILYQARAAISEEKRQELLEHYLAEAKKKTALDREDARRVFPVFALLRVLQTLGAYGLRGLVEGKGHFLRSIRPSVETSLKPLIMSGKLPLKEPELLRVLDLLVHDDALDPLQYLNKPAQKGRLTVRIQSFSYKRQVPKDPSGNGGGFV